MEIKHSLDSDGHFYLEYVFSPLQERILRYLVENESMEFKIYYPPDSFEQPYRVNKDFSIEEDVTDMKELRSNKFIQCGIDTVGGNAFYFLGENGLRYKQQYLL